MDETIRLHNKGLEGNSIFVDFIVVSTMRGSMLKREGRVEIRRLSGCDLIANTVLLYLLFCLTYTYCTLYVLYMYR